MPTRVPAGAGRCRAGRATRPTSAASAARNGSVRGVGAAGVWTPPGDVAQRRAAGLALAVDVRLGPRAGYFGGVAGLALWRVRFSPARSRALRPRPRFGGRGCGSPASSRRSGSRCSTLPLFFVDPRRAIDGAFLAIGDAWGCASSAESVRTVRTKRDLALFLARQRCIAIDAPPPSPASTPRAGMQAIDELVQFAIGLNLTAGDGCLVAPNG